MNLIARLALVATLVAVSCIGLAQLAPGKPQLVGVFAYEPRVAKDVIREAPDPRRTAVVFNIHSGPGGEISGTYAKQISDARRKGILIGYYIDAIVGGDYSPLVYVESGNFKVKQIREIRDKTPREIDIERQAWLRYSAPDFWLLDDLRARHSALCSAMASWPGFRVGNPGTSIPFPPSWRAGDILIIEESPLWPRALTDWERANKHRLGVVALSCTDFDKARQAAAGFAWFSAHQMNDNWQAGITAYNYTPSPLNKLYR